MLCAQGPRHTVTITEKPGVRDAGYLPFYFQEYRILSILLPGIWDTWFNIFITSRDIENFGKLIMGIFADL